MPIQRITAKEPFLSGTDEQQIYGKQHVYEFPGGTISFSFDQLIPLEDAEKKLSAVLFEQLTSQLDAIEKRLISYVSSEGLKLYLLETEDYFAVIAAGEFQPALHKIVVEGVFQK